MEKVEYEVAETRAECPSCDNYYWLDGVYTGIVKCSDCGKKFEIVEPKKESNWISLADRVPKDDKKEKIYLLLKKNHYGYKDFNYQNFMQFIETFIKRKDYKDYLWQKIELLEGE